MNAQMKRLRATGLALLVLLHSLFAVAQTPLPKTGKVYVEYGQESEMRIPSEVMRRTLTELPRPMRVQEILRSLRLFRQAGGIMFDSVGQPCAGLADAQLLLSHDRSRPDGQRLILHGRRKAYTVNGVYDRDLRPIAEFADSKVPILTNVQSPDGALNQSCPSPYSLKIVTLHPAFLNTNLGRQLTSMDSVPWSFSRGRLWNKRESIPQSTLSLSKSLTGALREDESSFARIWPVVGREFFNAGDSVLRSMDEGERKHYARLIEEDDRDDYEWKALEDEELDFPGFNRAAWNRLSVTDRRTLLLFIPTLRTLRVSNINDDDVPPSFCTQGSEVKLDGSLQLQFIAPRHPDNYTLTASSELMTKNLDQLRLVDEEGYHALMEIYRLGGLFRYVKRQSPAAWRRFFISLPPKERRDTYTIVCPGCTSAEVEDWLGCVEEQFPSPRPARRVRKR